jgi:hypothetical protein
MTSEQGDADVKALVDSKPGEPVLELVGKLARSFVDSIIQSDAVLLMTPQQQALCAVCHSLHKHGMPIQTTLQRYVKLACDDPDKQQAVLSSMQVYYLNLHFVPHCILCTRHSDITMITSGSVLLHIVGVAAGHFRPWKQVGCSRPPLV